MRQFGRSIEAYVNNRLFTSDKFTIFFDIPFDDTPFDNVAKLQIYNLSNDTINSFGKTPTVQINAGYSDDLGAVLLGIGSQTETTVQAQDRTKITEIQALDGSLAYYSNPIAKTYRKGMKASQIIDDLERLTGIRLGTVKLVKDFVYTRGFTAKGKYMDVVSRIASDCGCRAYTRNGQLFLAPKGTGKEIGFILNAETGLIGTPTMQTQEVTLSDKAQTKKKLIGWKIQCLLNHRISTDSIIKIESQAVTGVFRVESGRHFCTANDFLTELVVYPPG